MSYESRAEPIKIGYLMDFLLSDDFPQHYRDDLTIPFDMILGDALAKGIIDRPVEIIYREVKGLPDWLHGTKRRPRISTTDRPGPPAREASRRGSRPASHNVRTADRVTPRPLGKGTVKAVIDGWNTSRRDCRPAQSRGSHRAYAAGRDERS